nr:hypothetical protein CFP56_09067 [Quercus suber]
MSLSSVLGGGTVLALGGLALRYVTCQRAKRTRVWWSNLATTCRRNFSILIITALTLTLLFAISYDSVHHRSLAALDNVPSTVLARLTLFFRIKLSFFLSAAYPQRRDIPRTTNTVFVTRRRCRKQIFRLESQQEHPTLPTGKAGQPTRESSRPSALCSRTFRRSRSPRTQCESADYCRNPLPSLFAIQTALIAIKPTTKNSLAFGSTIVSLKSTPLSRRSGKNSRL